MNHIRIINIFKRIFSTHVNPTLGRWNYHNLKQTTLKIKYANEDNCGVSGNNFENTILTQTQLKENNEDDNEYIHFMGYESVHDKNV